MLTWGLTQKRYINSRSGHNRRRLINMVMLFGAGLMTLLALIPLFWIIIYVIIRGGAAINLNFFTQMPRPLGVAGGGVLPAIEGTLLLVVLAAIFAIPPGVLAAFYTSRHPNTPLGVAVRFGTDVMSGVPSIVVGLFGYALIVKSPGTLFGLCRRGSPGAFDAANHYPHDRRNAKISTGFAA